MLYLWMYSRKLRSDSQAQIETPLIVEYDTAVYSCIGSTTCTSSKLTLQLKAYLTALL